uniref:Putative secreted peptide n=1 Tax=Anopheles braziliensis TaxID=58242 RepID=A0A2M3ZSR5_9DIPT
MVVVPVLPVLLLVCCRWSLSRSRSSFSSSGCQTSCRYLTGQTPCRLSAERTITIPFSSSPTCITIWSRRSVNVPSPRSLSVTCRLWVTCSGFSEAASFAQYFEGK